MKLESKVSTSASNPSHDFNASLSAPTMPLIDPVTMSSAGASPQVITIKPSLPIELLPNDLARIFSQIHPAILLSAFYLRFPALVADPTSTLLSTLLPLAAVQILYAVVCLPAVGSNTKVVKKVKLNAPKKPEGAAATRILVGCWICLHVILDEMC